MIVYILYWFTGICLGIMIRELFIPKTKSIKQRTRSVYKISYPMRVQSKRYLYCYAGGRYRIMDVSADHITVKDMEGNNRIVKAKHVKKTFPGITVTQRVESCVEENQEWNEFQEFKQERQRAIEELTK